MMRLLVTLSIVVNAIVWIVLLDKAAGTADVSTETLMIVLGMACTNIIAFMVRMGEGD